MNLQHVDKQQIIFHLADEGRRGEIKRSSQLVNELPAADWMDSRLHVIQTDDKLYTLMSNATVHRSLQQRLFTTVTMDMPPC